MPGFTYLNDVQVGQQTQINMVSHGHGYKRLPLAETLSFKPKKTAGIVPEFDNTHGVMSFETFEGIDIAFTTTQADQTDKIAMLMDIDPNQTILLDDPAQHAQVTAIFTNFTGKNSGYKYGFVYAEQLRASEASESLSLKDPGKESYSFMGTWGVRAFGKTGQKCSVIYNRLVNTPAFSTSTDIAFTGSTATLTNTAIAVPQAGYTSPSGKTLNILSAFKNGQKMNIDSTLGTPDITVATTTATVAVAPVVGDVWDLFYVAQA
jgi:hypothetical protein